MRLGNFESVPDLCEARPRNVARGPVPRATLLHARDFDSPLLCFFTTAVFLLRGFFCCTVSPFSENFDRIVFFSAKNKKSGKGP